MPRSRFERRGLCDRKNIFLLLRKHLTAATNNCPFCAFTLTKFPGIHTHTHTQQQVSWFYLLNKVNIVRDRSFYCFVYSVYNLLGIKPWGGQPMLIKSNVVQRYSSWPVFCMHYAQLQAPNSLRGEVCTTFRQTATKWGNNSPHHWKWRKILAVPFTMKWAM